MKLIVGLGNPGKNFDNTRHNVGFMILDYYISDKKWKKRFDSLYYELKNKEENIIFIKPLTYMNLSGDSVKKFVDYYKIDMNDLLIIHDDLDLNLGKYKLKRESGSGGHNGINSIIESLRTNKFNRLKIGISNDKFIDAIDYVIKKFSKEELKKIELSMNKYKEIIQYYINNDFDSTMNKYNTKEE